MRPPSSLMVRISATSSPLPNHEARAGLGLFAGLENDFPIGEVETAEEQKLDCAARAFLHAVQARGDDARLVDDEHVAGVEVIDHVAEDFMLDRAGIAMVDEQAAAIARFDGVCAMSSCGSS